MVMLFLKLLIDNMKKLFIFNFQKGNFTQKKFPLAIKISKADKAMIWCPIYKNVALQVITLKN